MRHRSSNRRTKDVTSIRQKLILYAISQDKAAREASMYAYGPGSATSIINGDVGLIKVGEPKRTY